MIKSDLVNKIAEDAGLTKAQATEALNATLAAVKTALEKGEKVSLIGFGTFSTSSKPAREVRNPKTGEKFMADAKTVVKFKPGKELEDAVKA